MAATLAKAVRQVAKGGLQNSSRRCLSLASVSLQRPAENRRRRTVAMQRTSSEEERVFKENWNQRVDLATAYRGMEKYFMQEGVCNHLTAITPTLEREEPVMLLVPYGIYWGDVTPECLLGLDVATGAVIEGDGIPEETAHSIHRSVYKNRPDIKSIMHSHAQYSTVLANLKDPKIQMINQNSARFLKNVAYDMYYGDVTTAENDEGHRIATALGEGNDVMVMGHHGLLTVADRIDVAFDLHYYFEMAARTQVMSYMTGKELSYMDPTVAERTFEELNRDKGHYAEKHLDGMRKHLMRKDPDFIKTPKFVL